MKKKVIIALIVIFVVIILIITAAYAYIYSKIKKVNYIEIDKEDIEMNEGVEENLSNYRNIVFLGIDNTIDNYGIGNRSDCIIIANINEKTNEVKLISVYRDTYLEIEGRGLDKVNHAYAFGENLLAINTLNINLDLNITEFVTVNFNSVVDCVNALGGVEIEIAENEIKYINNNIKSTSKRTETESKEITKAGRQTLDGVQAVAYSRIRYTTGGDWKRTERMRTVLTAMLEKAKTKELSELMKIIDQILPEITTNIKTNEIISMIPQIVKYKVVESIGWPYEVKEFDSTGAWYGVPVTLESSVVRLHEEVFGETNYKVSNRVKEISDKIIEKTGYR